MNNDITKLDISNFSELPMDTPKKNEVARHSIFSQLKASGKIQLTTYVFPSFHKENKSGDIFDLCTRIRVSSRQTARGDSLKNLEEFELTSLAGLNRFKYQDLI